MKQLNILTNKQTNKIIIKESNDRRDANHVSTCNSYFIKVQVCFLYEKEKSVDIFYIELEHFQSIFGDFGSEKKPTQYLTFQMINLTQKKTKQ